VGHPPLVEKAHRLFEFVTAADAEAEVIETHPVLIETVAADGTIRIWGRTKP
jgi:hypothetical protein